MGKKHKLERCKVCNHTIDITDKLDIEDFDLSWREGYILVYCDECANQIEVKVK